MTYRTEPQFSSPDDNAYTEVCDRCEKLLDQCKNEDIYLSRVGVVLCRSCHGEHKGNEIYW